MIISVTLFIVAALVLLIWFFLEFKRMRHKIVAVLLIALVLFTYFSFILTLKPYDIDYKSVSGIVQAGGIYLSWLGSVWVNFKSITTHAISLDWANVNQTTKDKLDVEIK